MSKNKFELIFITLLIPLDGLMILVAFWVAYLIRVADILPFSAAYIMPASEYLRWVLFIIPLWIIIFALNKMYSFRKKPFFEELTLIFMSVSTSLAIIFALFFFTRTLFFSRLIIFIAWILAIIFVVIGRFLAKIVQKYLYMKGFGARKVIIVGAGQVARKIITKFSDRFLGYDVVGVIDGKLETGANFFRRVSVLGPLGVLAKITKKVDVSEIILADLKMTEKGINRLIEFCHDNRIVFRYSPSMFELPARNVEIDLLGEIPLLKIQRTPLEGWGRIVKRIIDIFGSSIALILFSPFFIVVPILIKFDSAGPIFFRQKRVGLGGNFNFLKFRSMREGAQKEHCRMMKKYGIMFKLKNDPRVTHLGVFLRRTSIDELPQLFNVFKGEMSLVGPRPPMPEEVAKYNKWQKKRLGVKPGMTGLWQVSGRSNVSFAEWVELDKYYIENWSLKLDFQILVRTFIILLTKIGAY